MVSNSNEFMLQSVKKSNVYSFTPSGIGICPKPFTILQQLEYSMRTFQHLKYIYDHYVGESGVVYKGYIDSLLGSELVAVKTGKGIKYCPVIDRLCEDMACVCTL